MNQQTSENEPTAYELNSLLTAAIECESIGGSSMETLHALYEARMKKFSWVGSYEIKLMFSLDAYLEHRGYKKPISTPIFVVLVKRQTPPQDSLTLSG